MTALFPANNYTGLAWIATIEYNGHPGERTSSQTACTLSTETYWGYDDPESVLMRKFPNKAVRKTESMEQITRYVNQVTAGRTISDNTEIHGSPKATSSLDMDDQHVVFRCSSGCWAKPGFMNL
jgi:hypothetical protein